jgi:anti-anti-sigma factor
VVLRPDGDIDHQTVAVLRDVLFDAFAPAVQTVIVDLDGATFLGAKGVGALLDGHDRALVLGVKFVLAGGGHAALRPLQVLGILEAISHHVSVEQALLSHPHLSQRVDPGPAAG